MNEGKVIVLDWMIFVFRAIMAWRKMKEMPVEYISLNMITSALRKIGVTPYDTVIVACDGRNSWRKSISQEYKANRKAFRDSFEDINWKDMWEKFDILLEKINKGTDWNVLKMENIEADDIASVACRYYKDKDIVLISYDSDWQLLWHYGERIKIWSILLRTFPSKGKGAYKIPANNFDAYTLLSKKVSKEKSDNLVSPILSEKDYEKRLMCVNLLELPEYIESQIVEKFDNLLDKKGDLSIIPFPSMRTRIGNLYNDTDKIITYESCVKRQEKKDKQKAKKKVKTVGRKNG